MSTNHRRAPTPCPFTDEECAANRARYWDTTTDPVPSAPTDEDRAAYLNHLAEKRLAEAPARDQAHAALLRHHSAKRRTVKMQRRPAWADDEAILAVYREAKRLTAETGIPHHVDHKYPLQGNLVSGLHVHNNLQILTASENSRKRNRFEVE